MAPAKKRSTRPTLDERSIREAEARVREAGAVPFTRLSAQRMTPSARAELVAALESRGLERYARGVRVSVEEQLRQCLAENETLSLDEVPGKLAGSPTVAEVRRAVERLLKDSAALLFATEGGEVLSRSKRPVDKDDVVALKSAVERLEALVDAARSTRGAPKKHIAHEEVAPIVAALADRFRPSSDPRLANVTPILEALDELTKVSPRDTDAVSLPALVLYLTTAGTFTRNEDALGAVVAAAGLGHLELLPDGSLGLLSEVDVELCPKGAGGALLRWVRRPQAAFASREETRPATGLPPRAVDATLGIDLERVDAWSSELFDEEAV